MNTITYKGKEISFEKFVPSMKHCVKANIVNEEGFTEGIWIVLTPEDHKEYNEKEHGVVIGVLANMPFHDFPFGWGAYIPIEYRGQDRPTCEAKCLRGEEIVYIAEEVIE